MLVQILGHPGRRFPLEIRRGADHRHAHVWADRNRDHVLRECFAEAYACIEALGDDVDEAVVDADLDVEVGIERQKAGDRRQEDRLGRLVADGNPDRSCRFVAQLGQGRQARFDPVEMRGDVRKRRSPASVVDTLRVVRLSRRRPSRFSKLLIA